MLGLLLPFLLIPDKLVNSHVVLKVDNIACCYGWDNRHVSGDECASVLVRALHMISAYLATSIAVQHLPRVSSWEARLVDRLSREESTWTSDKQLVDSFNLPQIPACLRDWMLKPSEDWNLPYKLLEHVTNIQNTAGI